jgi:hypothetical protein
MVIGDIMRKALIDTQASVQHIVSWSGQNAVYETYPNSARVCQVADAPFEVYQTLIWVDCADDVVQDEYYYDKETQVINPIENAPAPEPVQPDMDGIDSV